ncbi:MAG: hypothetical protein IJR87_07285 [Bacteroidaceae bacterium]|nr:hypothetical protein [Bacteroidaceae bacterium]
MENYSRFYAILGRLPYSGDREELKKSVVRQYTWDRTEHLHEMTEQEYNDCCAGMERMVLPGEPGGNARSIFIMERKRRRSSALHQLQLYGVDTTDWDKVNEFCRQPRIAGKEFRDLDCEELEALTKKMRAIIRKRDKEQ